MASDPKNAEQDSLHCSVNAWRDAGPELEAIRHREAESISVHEAIRQIFDGMESLLTAPAPTYSGLVEQQKWFSRIRNSGSWQQQVAPPSNE